MLSNIIYKMDGFSITVIGLSAWLIYDLSKSRNIIIDSIDATKPKNSRVNYFTKGTNAIAEQVSLNRIWGFLDPIFKAKNWTQSRTKQERSHFLSLSRSSNPADRALATEYITKHHLRTGSGVSGTAGRLYDYYG